MSHVIDSRLTSMSHVSREWVTSLVIEYVSRQWDMSHVNDSCLTRMSHVSREYEWVTSHVNESCLISMSHVSREWVLSHVNASCLTPTRHVTSEWVMSHVKESSLTWMSHVSRQCAVATTFALQVQQTSARGGGLGSGPKKMYGERLGDGVEHHLMSPTPRR